MKEKIRVCFLPVSGGQEPSQELTIKALNKNGRYEALHGVHARFFPATRTCLKYRPDVLYFDWIDRYISGRSRLVTAAKMAAFFLDVQIATKIFRRPIFWSLHNLQAHEQSMPAGWERVMQRYFARHATRIRVFSQSAIKRACAGLQVDCEKLEVVPMGSHAEYYPNVISRAEARTRLGLAAGDFILLWLGNIRPYKGLQELIETFQKAARPHWRLVIAGKPYIESYAHEVSAMVEGNPQIRLEFRFIPNDELQVFYNAADAVVLPFAEVENSSSLVVAMGFKKPVVAPDLGVIGERLCRQRELVYAPGGLEDAMRTLASLPPERLEQIGRANLEEVTKYKWADIVKLFQGVKDAG